MYIIIYIYTKGLSNENGTGLSFVSQYGYDADLMNFGRNVSFDLVYHFFEAHVRN